MNDPSRIPPPAAKNYLVTTPADRDTVRIQADKLSFGGFHFKDVDLTLNIEKPGLLGLDADASAVSTWYYPHLLTDAKGTRLSGVLSTNAVTPAAQDGYTVTWLGGAVYNNAASDFYRFQYQNGWWWWNEDQRLPPLNFVTGALPGFVWTPVSPLVPSPSKLIKFTAEINCTCVGDDYVAVRPKGSNWGVGPAVVERQRSIAAGTIDGGCAERPTDDNGDLDVWVPHGAPLTTHLDMLAFYFNPFA